MSKLTILSIITILSVLSGCIGNNGVDKINGNSTYNDNIDNNNTKNIDNTIKYKEDGNENLETFANEDDIEEDNSQIIDMNGNKNSDNWCRPEDKITIDGKEYTIKGITEYKGENMCKGEKTSGNTIETVLFSEDGSTKCTSSESYSGSSSAKAFACVKKMK